MNNILFLIVSAIFYQGSVFSQTISPQPKPEKSSAVLRLERDFFHAVYEGKEKPVIFFLDSGVDINLRNEAGKTALMIASEHGHLEMVKELLSRGADRKLTTLDVTSHKNLRAYDFAMAAGQKKTAEILK